MKRHHLALTLFSAIFVLILALPTQADVLVTRRRQAQLGAITEKGTKLMVATEFGSIGFAKDQVAWYHQDPAVDTFLEAGYEAERDGKDMVAMFLFQLSLQKEKASSKQASAAIRAIKLRHMPKTEAPEATATGASAGNAPLKPAPKPENLILKEIEGDLVALNGRRTSRVKADDVADVDYYAVYFSAHWCGPCRHFTPELVNFYNEMKAADKDNFEIVFVSRDHSDDDMEDYMAEAKMPWPALKYSAIKRSDLNKYAGRGIPCLVLVDRQGNVISSSYQDGKYVGAHKVMADMRRTLQGP